MRAVVLGAAAGGGFPQWNCGCRNCVAVRDGRPGFLPRTQSSLAISATGGEWAILNASPDIRAQIDATPELHPTGPRISPIRSVLVTNGDLDHVAGLLTLREKQPFSLVLTEEIARLLDENPIFRVLNPAFVKRRIVRLEESFELVSGVSARLFAVPGKVPLYAEQGEVRTDLEGEQTVGVALSQASSPAAFYIPGCARMTPALAKRLAGAPLVFFDGTLWKDDEMIAAGVGEKTGARMGHMAIGGAEGTIAAFTPLGVGRRVFVHINNTNPVLDPRSPERTEAERAGWEIGYDGMEVTW